MKIRVLLGLALISGASLGWAMPRTSAVPADRDSYEVWRHSRSFKGVAGKGAKIVNFPEEQNFFAYWVPKNYKSGRIMVAVHGTGGNPYEELKDEISLAEKFDYMVIAVNWFSPRTGYLKARDLYRNILEALNYIREQYHNDLSAVAYIGFSRGAAVSYEIAYLDSGTDKVFDLFIAHSGGIPRNLKTEAENSSAAEDLFFSAIAGGRLGPDALKGARFFLYSGDKDQQWGLEMSLQMEYAAGLIRKNGGEVVEYVRDPEGGHAGLRRNPEINEKAVRHFIELTS